MNWNKAQLGGHLARDPELKSLQDGKCLVSFTVAVNSGFGDRKSTLFMPMTAFNKRAEVIEKHFSKGDAILVEGELQEDKWTGKDGVEKKRVKMVVNDFSFVSAPSKKPARQVEPDGQISAMHVKIDDDLVPF